MDNTYPIAKQSFLENILFSKVLKRTGFKRMGAYFRTTLRNPNAIYPFMLESLPEDAFLYDFHSHTQYSDGKGDFRHILLEIERKQHLNGLAFTDHPSYYDRVKKEYFIEPKVIRRSFKAQKIADRLKRQGKINEEFVTFPGSCEFAVRLKEDKPSSEIELIALGIPEDFVKKNGGIRKIARMDALNFIENVHDDNGLVIVPHPFWFTRAHELLKMKKLSRNATPDAFESQNFTIGFLINEALHPYFEKVKPFYRELIFLSKIFGYFNWIATIISEANPYGRHYDYPIARKIAAVGSSDAHFMSMVGAGCTMTREPIHSFEDLRNVFKQKKGTPMLNAKWALNTETNEWFAEVIEEYGPKINDLIRNSNLGLINKLLVLKIVIKTLVSIFSLEIMKKL